LPPRSLPKKEASTTNGNITSKKAMNTTDTYIVYKACMKRISSIIISEYIPFAGFMALLKAGFQLINPAGLPKTLPGGYIFMFNCANLAVKPLPLPS
jgi:hypothetical protein